MNLVFHHKGKYTADDFTIDEVILSLSAQKELIEAGLLLLAEIDPNFHYDGAKISVQYVKSGTLGWDLLVQVFGKYQQRIQDEVIRGIEEMFGVEIPEEMKFIVTLATLAVTYAVARYAYESVTRNKEDKTPSIHIAGDGNVVVQQIADIIGANQEDVERALDKSLPPSKRKKLTASVADFFRPSKKKPGEKIEIVGAPDVSPETLQEFPSDADISSVDDSKNVDVEGAIVDIRGTDRDKHKQGWHAMIVGDERFPKRLPMDLYPTVNPDALANHKSVRANLIVECERLPDGNLKAKRIHLLSFEPPSE